MLYEVDSAPLAFEQAVYAKAAAPLAEHGFQYELPFHLYQNQIVSFARERHGQREVIEFQRASYGEEQMREGSYNDNVDKAPDYVDGEKHWVSRQLMCVQLIVGTATGYLLTSGSVGTSETDEEWWHFVDEDDLRRRLEETLPLILTAGLQSFDDSLEDILTEQRAPTTA